MYMTRGKGTYANGKDRRERESERSGGVLDLEVDRGSMRRPVKG